MTERNPGMRVGVFPVDLADDAHAYHHGKGTYEGDFIPPYDFQPEELTEEYFGGAPQLTPRIKLDSGEEIWGYECFWMPEEEFDESLKDAEALGKEVTLVRFTREADANPN